MRKLKVAIVHDYLRTYGGGERVLLGLHKIWPDATIYVATADYERLGVFGSTFKKLPIRTSLAQKIRLFVKKPILYRPILPLVWNSLDLGDVDLVISSSGGNIAKGIKVPKNAIHICYCHTPPRFLYGYKTETNLLRIPLIGILAKFVFRLLLKYDKATSSKVDYFIANSENVSGRIRKYYDRDSIVIYPPCDVSPKYIKPQKGSYFLVVSRLVRYKNVDLIIKAFNRLSLNLKIAGNGTDINKLKKMAGKNVKFMGQVDDKRLHDLYRNCRALVVATEDEDFGMTPVEAQGHGKPVIAYFSGGLKETVNDGATGVFFKKLTVNDLIKAVRRFEKKKFDFWDCYVNATKFSELVFSKKIVKFVTSKTDNIH